MRNKTFARIASIQVMYQYHLNSIKDFVEITDIIIGYYKDNLHENKFFDKNIAFMLDLTKLLHENIADINQYISANLNSKWTINSLHITLRSVLQVAIAELLYFNNTPTKVIINEYTSISVEMLSVNEEDFVNAILQNISSQVRVE